MIRKLGVLALVCGGVLLAGCVAPTWPSSSYPVEKRSLLQKLGTPTHQCGTHWSSIANDLEAALAGEMARQIEAAGPLPTGQLPTAVPWANRQAGTVDTTGIKEKAIRDSLLRLVKTLSYATEMDRYDDQPRPITAPPVELRGTQIDIARLALELEDLFEADRFSGHHPTCGQAKWWNTTPPDLAPLLRALRDALDM